VVVTGVVMMAGVRVVVGEGVECVEEGEVVVVVVIVVDGSTISFGGAKVEEEEEEDVVAVAEGVEG
jgi:hypothetical protein